MRTPGKFVLAALLSSCITTMASASIIVLCSTALAFRYDCYAGNLLSMTGSRYLLTMIFKLYIQDENCPNSIQIEALTTSLTVFVLICLTLCFSIVNLFGAMALTITTLMENGARYLDCVTYSYMGLWVASFMIDLTLAINFGMDYSVLTSHLDESTAGQKSNYEFDTLRIGALCLMTLSMKGFVAHAVNAVMLVMMLIYLREFEARLLRQEHSIHRRGILSAYEVPRRGEDIWQMQEDWAAGFGRGENEYQDFIHEEYHPRAPTQPNPRLQSIQEVPRRSHRRRSNTVHSFSHLDDSGRFLSPQHISHLKPMRRRLLPATPPTLPQPDYGPEPERLTSFRTVYI